MQNELYIKHYANKELIETLMITYRKMTIEKISRILKLIILK